MRRFFPLLFIVFYCAGVSAQLNFPADKQHAKLTILAEYHGIANVPTLKAIMMEQLHDNANVKHIALEAGRGAVYLCNEYIRTGEDAILTLLYPKNHKDFFLQELRRMHEEGKNITLHGIDFERMEALLAIQYLMEKKAMTDNKLYRLISEKQGSITELRTNDKLRAERQKLLDECQTVYKENTKYYDQIKDTDFSVKAVFNNPASETKFAKRDAAMAENMLRVLASTKDNVLLIAGTYHIENNGKLYKQLVNKVKLERGDMRIISMLCKDCSPKAMYFEQRKVPYLGYKVLVNDTATAGRIFARYSTPEQLNIVTANNAFYKEFGLKKAEDMDYVMLVDCRD